eukprot:s571_g4.t1
MAATSSRIPISDSIPEGPRNGEESDAWPQRFWQCLQNHSLDQVLARNIQDGIRISTDYSGMGTGEEAMRQLCLVCWQHTGGQPEAEHLGEKFFCQRATDVDAFCRHVLMHHDELFRPRCLFGDIVERMPDHCKDAISKRLKREQASDKSGGNQRKRKHSDSGREAVPQHVQLSEGRMLIRNAAQLLLANHHPKKDWRATCYAHGKHKCCLNATAPQDFAGISINITGFTCVDWSVFGSKCKWHGDAALPWCQWVTERIRCQEDVILCECTPSFDHQLLRELLQGTHDMETLLVGPDILGEPVLRTRLFMVLLKRSSMAWDDATQSAGVQARFESIFGHTTVMSVLEKFRATGSDVDAYLKALAKSKHMPETSRSGKAWSWIHLCSAAQRASVKEHRDALERHVSSEVELETKKNLGKGSEWICNLRQTPEHVPALWRRVPTLMRKSLLYVFGLRRVGLPLESLELQGWNVFGSRASHGSLTDCLRCLPSSQAMSLSGNGMHLHVLGSLMFFIFSCTRRADRFANPLGLEDCSI